MNQVLLKVEFNCRSTDDLDILVEFLMFRVSLLFRFVFA